MSVLEQWVLFLKVACDESSYSLFFRDVSHHLFELLVRLNELSLESLIFRMRVGRGSINL